MVAPDIVEAAGNGDTFSFPEVRTVWNNTRSLSVSLLPYFHYHSKYCPGCMYAREISSFVL